MILPSVSADDAPKLFPEFKVVSVPSGKKYIRVTPQPKQTEKHYSVIQLSKFTNADFSIGFEELDLFELS